MASNNTTILCVDDEQTPRTLRKLILEKQGYQVITAASGAEALEILTRHSIDLVLSDQMMPGMSGTELAKSVKSMHPAMPVILISGVNEIPADAHHADRFVSKIGGPELLFKTLAEVLAEPKFSNLPNSSTEEEKRDASRRREKKNI
jgi:CheY-like chemotaxis protein